MINFNEVMDDYLRFISSYKKYKLCKSNLHDFYMQNFYELETHLSEYYEYINDREKLTILFETYPILRDYVSLETITNHYKEKYIKYQVSPEIRKFGKSVLCRLNSTTFVIYDLENCVNYSFETNDIKIAKYIELALKKINKFVTRIYLNEISVMKVIYLEIKTNESYLQLSPEKQCKKLESELIKARMFDDSYIVDGKEVLPFNIDEEFTKLLCMYRDGKISKDNYYKKFYYYRIISGENIEKMYINADKEQKDYIMQVYIELSTNNFNQKGKVHVRTTSKLINKEVLERKNKPDTD